MSTKVRGYKIKLHGAIINLYAGDSLEDVQTALEQVVGLDELAVGDSVTITVIELEPEVFQEMREFPGW